MSLDRLADVDPDPAPGDVMDMELAVTDDVLVKLFALGAGAEIEPHEHPAATNVFHVLRGAPTVLRAGEDEPVSAPAVVLNERGHPHGVRNETDEPVVLTASLCPLPG